MSSTCPLIWESYFSSSGFFLFLFKSQIYLIAGAVQWHFRIFDAVVCLFGIGLPGLELTFLIEQVGLKLMETCLLLPPNCWSQRHVPPYPAILISDSQRHTPPYPAILVSAGDQLLFLCQDFLWLSRFPLRCNWESSSPSLKLLIESH